MKPMRPYSSLFSPRSCRSTSLRPLSFRAVSHETKSADPAVQLSNFHTDCQVEKVDFAVEVDGIDLKSAES